MRVKKHLGVLLLVSACTTATLTGAAQTAPASNPAPCSAAPQPEPCGSAPMPGSKPAATTKFPFPGEASGTATPDSPAPSLSGSPQVPDAPGAAPAPAAKKKFPFPGEVTPSDPAVSKDASSSSSSGDQPTFDPDANPAPPALTDKGSQGTPATPGRHILHRVNPVGTKLQTADEREMEDLDVAHFYLQSGDLQGAYLRSQDAVKTVPDDPDAHFVLAGIALKLNKREEAIAEYTACLKLDPPDNQARDARKALAHLKP